MTALDELDAATRPRLWRAARLFVFLLTEGAAVLLIGFAALFVNLQPAWSGSLPPAGVAAAAAPDGGEGTLRERVRRFELALIRRAIDDAGGDRRVAAQRLSIGLSSLYRKLEEAPDA